MRFARPLTFALACLAAIAAACASSGSRPSTTAATSDASTSKAPAKPPHIVHIVADDLGWADVGFNGSDIQTPNLDKLAKGGAVMKQFYAQPMCTPTRACIMTGRYPFRYGLQTAVIPSGHTYGLAKDEYLLPQALKEAGYDTAIVGKWHLGHGERGYWPRQRGFDHAYGPLIGEIDYFTHEQHGIVDWYRDNQPIKEEGYSTTLLGNDAVKLIEGHDPAKPLYLYLTFNAPHTPYQATPEYLEKYKHIADPTRRTYAAMITALDDQVGRVLDALQRRGMRDNTLILFNSDNGGTRDSMFTGEVDMTGVTLPCNNGPFRAGKGMLYEGGTRVCACANWPGRIPAGSSVDGMMHVADIFPTLARVAGASTAKCKPLDGMDMWPTLTKGVPSPRTEIVYNIEPFRGAVREGEWKLVWRTLLPQSVELFDVVRDPGEKTNVADANPEKVEQLQKRINALAGQMAKPLILQVEFAEVRKRLKMPPAFPDQEFDLMEADIAVPKAH